MLKSFYLSYIRNVKHRNILFNFIFKPGPKNKSNIFNINKKMASGGSVRLYEEDDRLDERLLNQISKWIMYDRLPSLARNLGFSDAEISRIMIHYRTPEEHCFQVLNLFETCNQIMKISNFLIRFCHDLSL